jgi:fibrillarin-like pre-rRNA processing protein
MKQIGNLIYDKNKIYTLSKNKLQWYGEKLIKAKKGFLRQWDPNKSKIGSALKKELSYDFSNKRILYLGCSSGTTVSHLSDLTEKEIIGVDIGAITMKEFLDLSEKRINVIPLLYDAAKLEEFKPLVGEKFDLVFQDIAQRDMTETFIKNIKLFLGNGEAWISLKTNSIDSTKSPKKVLNEELEKIKKAGLKVINSFDLEPFEKNHFFIIVKQ